MLDPAERFASSALSPARDLSLEVGEKKLDVLFRAVPVAAIKRRRAEKGARIDERVGGAFEPPDRAFGAPREKLDGAGRRKVPSRPLRIQTFDLIDERSPALGIPEHRDDARRVDERIG